MHNALMSAYSLTRVCACFFGGCMDEKNIKKQTLQLESREILRANCVINVESFNEEYLEICTALGILCVEGADLKIEELTGENGNILVKGRINAFFFKEEHKIKKAFSGIFK